MAHSLEVRHPYLDHRLVDFVLGLPAEWKIKNGWTKYVLRRSFPELPKRVRWRRDKQPFTTPEAYWLRNEFSPVIRETFKKSALGELQLIDARRFLAYYEEFRNGARISSSDIARTFIAELWAQKFLQRTPLVQLQAVG